MALEDGKRHRDIISISIVKREDRIAARSVIPGQLREALLKADNRPSFSPRLHRQATPEHQAGRLAEGPLQVRVADLLAARALHLAGISCGTPHQPAVGEEVARPRGSGAMSWIS